MTDASYNKFSAIAIGGTYVNNIPTTFGNVSLDVSGHAAIRGNLYVSGTANIDISGGGFSGNDLSLNGNIYLGNSLYSTAPDGSFNIYSNAITHKSKDGATTYMLQDYAVGPDDIEWDSYKNFTLSSADGYYLNATSGASMGYDASLDVTFTARNGVMNFYAEQNTMLFDASVGYMVNTYNDDIYLNPKASGTDGLVVIDGGLQISGNVNCTSPSGILNINAADNIDVYASTGSQMNFYQSTVTTKSMTIGYDSITSNGYIGSGGTNVDLSISSGRYIKLISPIYCSYVPTDITVNTQIGWTQNANYGNSYTGTASDNPATISQVGTFTLPSQGVWMIQFTCEITLNTGSDTITNKRIVLSDNTASATECAPGFSMYIELDDAAGGSGLRNIYNFCGIYHYGLSGTTANKYINVCAPTSGSRTVTASGDYKYTRIA